MSVPYKPWPYQLQAIKFIIAHACAGLLLDLGLGKCSIMLASFSLLRKQKMVRRMLVIAPLRVCYLTWPAEVKKWADFEGLKVGILHGPGKAAALNDPAVDVHLINPEGLPWLFNQMEVDPKDYWEVLCVDESTKFKASNTQRFKLLRSRLPRFARRYILTGSPAPNGLLDLWGQVFILDLGNSLGAYITHYRSNYFDPDFTGYNWKPRADSETKIYNKLRPLCLRMEAKDYLQLPPLVGACGIPGAEPLVKWVELPPDAQRAYDQMQELLITTLSDEAVTAANAAAASGKCRQIANGGLYAVDSEGRLASSVPGLLHLGSGRSYHQIHEEKVDALEELIEQLQGTPALVAYEFEHDLARLLKRFPGTPHIGGGVSAKRFAEIERGWNAGDIPILFAQPQSVAHGLNLQGTKAHVIWHSIPWDFDVYGQFNGRVFRQGQKYPVFVHHIAAKGTIDEIILKTLQKKHLVQYNLLAALKEGYAVQKFRGPKGVGQARLR